MIPPLYPLVQRRSTPQLGRPASSGPIPSAHPASALGFFLLAQLLLQRLQPRKLVELVRLRHHFCLSTVYSGQALHSGSLTTALLPLRAGCCTAIACQKAAFTSASGLVTPPSTLGKSEGCWQRHRASGTRWPRSGNLLKVPAS